MTGLTIKALDPELNERAEALSDFVEGWSVNDALAFLHLAESTPTLYDLTRFARLIRDLHQQFVTDYDTGAGRLFNLLPDAE